MKSQKEILDEINENINEQSKSLFEMKNNSSGGELFAPLLNINPPRMKRKKDQFRVARENLIFDRELNRIERTIEFSLKKENERVEELATIKKSCVEEFDKIRGVMEEFTPESEEDVQLMNYYRTTSMTLKSFLITIEIISKNNKYLNDKFREYKEVGIPLIRKQQELALTQTRRLTLFKIIAQEKSNLSQLDKFKERQHRASINAMEDFQLELENKFNKDLVESEKLKAKYLKEK